MGPWRCEKCARFTNQVGGQNFRTENGFIRMYVCTNCADKETKRLLADIAKGLSK